MSKIDDAVREAVESFVEQLTHLIQRAALESVQAALNGGSGSSQRGPAREFVRASVATERHQVGFKRTPAELATLIKKLHGYIAKHPGQRIETIGTGLGVPTKALVLPVKRLISERKLTTKGQKRATLYFAQ
jgi:hypothetical protein